MKNVLTITTIMISCMYFSQVGIGAPQPESGTQLDVRTKADSYGFQHSDDNIKIRSYIGKGDSNGNTDAGWLGTYSDHALDFMTNAQSRMRITADGRVGIGTSKPSLGSALDITSTTGGILPPRMTTDERDAITEKQAGLIIYNTNENALQYWNGTSWISYSSAEQRIFAVISKSARQTIATGGGRLITWQEKTGVNSNLISIDGSNITLPAHKTFLIQGYLAWVWQSTISASQAWMKYQFKTSTGGNVGQLNIAGFAEGSTEGSADGGANPATAIINTGDSPITIRIQTLGTGGSSQNIVLSDGEGNTGTSYVTVQEL